ncbi:hypothetical protein C7441_12527 [Pseudaminobacter salicylatoxidans]|uniref:Uncharacterized protein n=1 Tax=Pseudaminobacter salicylatoxidans TaxID=93369 RepID=A0A316BL82_PSESE|nr:hypothetical protein [Pseudaminobacter salicylatoxidans]PWJ73843.1 hypothetical protein C7441_12527 [Pseudaminobacter salicylatoxidans]
MKPVEKRLPATRVDGSRRIDLAGQRAQREAARQAKATAPTVEDTRVRDVWQRQELRDHASARLSAEGKRLAKLRKIDGLKEGAKVSKVRVRVTDSRYTTKLMRARPGTFEWRYGRDKQDAFFHAGSHFALLWERAGVAIASPSDFLRGIKSGYATGISDGRVAAYDKLKGAVESLGRFSFERLMLYCVQGLTAAEIAKRDGQTDREAATVLHNDLRECAIHFNFLAPCGKRIVSGKK